MVKADAGDDRQDRCADVGRVEASAKSRLEHQGVDAFPRVEQKRDGGQRLEEGEVGSWRAGDRCRDPGGAILEDVVGDGASVKEEALVERDEMGRRVASDAKARLPQAGVEHGADGALSVRASDMDGGDGQLGVSEHGAEGADGVKSGLHAEATARGEFREKGRLFGIGHIHFQSSSTPAATAP